jgi:hypothetical protein
VTTLIAWAAKRAIIARITNWADPAIALPADPLYGVQVGYTLPPQPDRICVYGGRVRSVRAQATGEHASLFQEDVTVEVRVRVFEPGGDVEDTERVAEGIAQRIAAAVSAEPRLTSTGAVAVTSTDADPTILSPDPEPSVTANVVLTVSLSMFTQGA